MPDLAVFLRRLSPLAILLAIAAHAPDAQAQSRRERAAAAINERMAAAETRYREALVKVGNNDPAGVAESNAALEDMEDAMAACLDERGCSVTNLLPAYKRLLKEQTDLAAGLEEGMDTLADVDGDLPTGEVPDAASAAALLSEDGQRFVRMVQFNPAVQAGIRRWLTDMRPSLVNSYENYQYMRHLMSPAFEQRGLPEALLFGILAKESNGKVHVGSRAGAIGPLQFMPATGRRFGLGPDGTGFDTRYDPRASADAAAVYLGERFAEFGNDIEMWLAAYNGGEGRARRIHRESNGRKFWDADVYGQFPPETKDYVPMVIAAAWLYLHPKEYGLHWPRIDTRPATFTLERPSSIYALTICLGDSGTHDGYMRALRNLNPRYDADALIPAGATLNGTVRMAGLYRRWCAQGKRADLAQRLVESSVDAAIVRAGPATPATDAPAVPTTVATGVPASTRGPREHRVGRGDTLVSIAREYSCDPKALARANDVEAPRYMIRPGQRIKLQGCRQ